MTTEHKPPLIVRLPNWVGDVIMSLPALKLLDKAGFELHLFGRGWIKDLLASTHYHLYTIPKSICRIRHAVKQCPAKHAVLLTNSFSSAFQFSISGKKTLGYNTDARRIFLSYRLEKPKREHEAQLYSKLALEAIKLWSKHHLNNTPSTNLPLLAPQQNLLTTLKQRFPESLEGRYWALCPFATGLTKAGLPKIWPYWLDLIRHLKQQNIKLVVCPGPGEEEICQQFTRYIFQLNGLSLSEYAAVLHGAEQVIANDSGPMHLASAVGAHTLGIFGTTDPELTAPLGGEHIGSAQQWPTINEVLSKLNTIRLVL